MRCSWRPTRGRSTAHLGITIELRELRRPNVARLSVVTETTGKPFDMASDSGRWHPRSTAAAGKALQRLGPQRQLGQRQRTLV